MKSELILYRIRKVKCDKDKPSCQRCVKTGRACDGYVSPFRNHSGPNTHDRQSSTCPLAFSQTGLKVTQQDIEMLNRCFSTKTMFNVELGCNDEAEKGLEASLTGPSIRNAILSLRALREDLELVGDSPAIPSQQTQSHKKALQQYALALGGLASDLDTPDSATVKSALLCCQIFISIEQARRNFGAMAQHIIQGLRIMHECRARPGLGSGSELLPAYHEGLPLVDVFVIKLFLAPCHFAEPPTIVTMNPKLSPVYPNQPSPTSLESGELPRLAPNMRPDLVRIAESTLDFLARVSQVKSMETAHQLWPEREGLLASLESWLGDVEAQITSTGSEPLAMAFQRVFQMVLKIVLLSTLGSSL
jgi:hypothetical protein